jgi:hypothetical protein
MIRTRQLTLFDNLVDASFTDERDNTSHPSQEHNLGIKSMQDCLTPGYGQKRSSGGVLPYLFTSIHTDTAVYVPCSFDIRRNSDNKRIYGTQLGGPPVGLSLPALPAYDEGAIAFVLNSAIAEAKSESFDALTFAAELQKTSRMVGNRVEAVFRYGRRASSRATKHKNPYSAFANYWLEYRYGWRPLLMDIDNVLKQLREKARPFNEGHSEAVVDLSASDSQTESYSESNVNWSAIRTGTRTYRGFALAVGDFGTVPTFQPVRTAWELIPFSFVLDWLIDVGSFLNAITPIPGVNIRASGYSVKDDVTDVLSFVHVTKPGSGYTVLSSTPSSATFTKRYYERYPSNVLLPRLHSRLNQLRILDVAALVLQRALPFSRFLLKR